MKIKFIGHSYHQSTKSSQFFIRIVESLGEMDYWWDESWMKPGEPNDFGDLTAFDLVIVWQLPHIIRRIPDEIRSRTVYVPMHDAVEGLEDKFWRRLKGIRILSLSMATHIKALKQGLPALFAQYYPEPSPQTHDFDGLRLFFWQRQRSPNWRTVSAHLPPCQFDAIHIHRSVDPGAGEFVAPLPCEVEAHHITFSDWFESKDDLLEVMKSCNTYVAPRESEGIGMSLLEALSMGMVCIAKDAPTMNEYIIDGVNGHLINDLSTTAIEIHAPETTSRQALHYIEKGRLNYEARIPAIRAFLTHRPTAQPRSRHWALDRVLPPPTPSSTWMAELDQLFEKFRARKRPDTPHVSVITVVRNDANGLLKTLHSVFSQTYQNFEYVVIDGASTDATRQVLAKYLGAMDVQASGPDQGPYDAMNKGAQLARGDFVIYMNAGDEFFDPQALQSAMAMHPQDVDIIYGHHIFITKKKRPEYRKAHGLQQSFDRLKNGTLDKHWLRGIPCHQSTITRRTLITQRGYDWQTYRVAADLDLLLDAIADGANVYHSNTTISRYYGGGMSSKQGDICALNWQSIFHKHCDRQALIEQLFKKS